MDLSKLAHELLILILEELDPESLCRFSQASKRVLVIVLNFRPLRYRLELALSGMKNGPPSNYPPSSRLRQLLKYKRALPTLCWSQDENLQIPMPALVGVSGGYFYYAGAIAFQSHLELYELPSLRIGRAYPSRRRLSYPVPFAIRSITIDAAQDLMVIGEIFQMNGLISVRLHFRQLSINKIHPQSSVGRVTFSLDWGDDPEHKVSIHQVEICGDIVGLSLGLDIGHERTNKFALVHWRTGEAIMWVSEVLSFQFLDETRIIVVVQPDEDEEDDESDDCVLQSDCSSPCLAKDETTGPILAIHSFIDLRDSEGAQLRVYHLPDTWGHAVCIQIEPNTSPKSESHVMAGTFFYPDPACRIFVLSAIFHSGQARVKYSPRTVLIVQESVFKSPEPGPFDMSWNRWRRHCLLRDLSQAAHSLRVIGTRILFSEWVPDGKRPSATAHIPRSHVRLIDFNPHAIECIRPSVKSAGPWTWTGRWTTITAIEPIRDFPHIRTRTVDSYEISKFFATEDNLVLLLVCPNVPGALVKILTLDGLPVSLLD